MKKEPKKYWYLHLDYIDNYGMQHSLKYKMPKDFQQSVCCVCDDPELFRPITLTQE